MQLLNQLSKSLGNIWPNDTTPPADPLPTVKDFVNKLNQLLDKCGKTIRTGSKQHRLLYSTQQDYNKVRRMGVLTISHFILFVLPLKEY